MSDQANKKSRRRFLADMLFLGGGLTAAGLLARTRFNDNPDVKTSPLPQPTGDLTPSDVTTPIKDCPLPPNGPYPGEMVAPTPEVQAPGVVAAPPTPASHDGPDFAGGVRLAPPPSTQR